MWVVVGPAAGELVGAGVHAPQRPAEAVVDDSELYESPTLLIGSAVTREAHALMVALDANGDITFLSPGAIADRIEDEAEHG